MGASLPDRFHRLSGCQLPSAASPPSSWDDASQIEACAPNGLRDDTSQRGEMETRQRTMPHVGHRTFEREASYRLRIGRSNSLPVSLAPTLWMAAGARHVPGYRQVTGTQLSHFKKDANQMEQVQRLATRMIQG